MKGALTVATGGPLISLETTPNKPDSMAIVWMSISSDHSPVEGYRVYLNGQMCGSLVILFLQNSEICLSLEVPRYSRILF